VFAFIYFFCQLSARIVQKELGVERHALENRGMKGMWCRNGTRKKNFFLGGGRQWTAFHSGIEGPGNSRSNCGRRQIFSPKILDFGF